MFQPNSIKSLLSKRTSKIASDSKEQSSGQQDPDYQIIIEARVMAKQIEAKIENIREWRKDQKQMIEQKMRLNSEIAEESKIAHLQQIEKESQKEEKQLKQVLEKLNEVSEIKIKQTEEYFDYDKIFKVIKQTQQLVSNLKTEQRAANKMNKYDGLVDSMEEMNGIFRNQNKSENEGTGKQKGKVDLEALKKQMDEIDSQLKEIEDLLD